MKVWVVATFFILLLAEYLYVIKFIKLNNIFYIQLSELNYRDPLQGLYIFSTTYYEKWIILLLLK